MQVKVTVTGAPYQPAAVFGLLEVGAPLIVGPVPGVQLIVPADSGLPVTLSSSTQKTGLKPPTHSVREAMVNPSLLRLRAWPVGRS